MCLSHYDEVMADLGSPTLTPAFAPIAGGWFAMGTQLGHENEPPPYTVFVERLELGVCPATRAEYECFLGRHQARAAPRLVASAICTGGSPRRGRELDRRGRVLRVAFRARRAPRPVAD